jgi:RNA polymerase sigma-54 factor
MELRTELALLPQQQQKVSPRLVAVNHILELGSMELQELIEKELEENPALELVETTVCPTCGAAISGPVCTHCLSHAQKTRELEETQPEDEEYYYPETAAGGARRTDDEFDPMTMVAAQVTLEEHLLNELRPMLSADQVPVAEYLIGNLDSRGYLQCSASEAAAELGVLVETVEQVIGLLQSVEPVGIGARTLEECLCIQLDYLAAHGVSHPHAREIVEHYLEELGEHKYGRIAQRLGIRPEEVAAAAEFIKRSLNPHPAQSFYSGNRNAHVAAGSYVLPDVIITKRDRGYEIDIVESKRFFLKINPLYTRLLSQAEDVGISEEERRHIQQYVSRAKQFLANIHQRRQTLLKITACIVAHQREFLSRGVRYLRPLTRAMVAAELGMHESTVSRATAAKYVMLPSGQVIPFSDFFTPSLSVKDVIKDLIEHETAPLTDEQIRDELAKRGLHIARRTVAKYRDQLKILPSSLR